MDYEVQWDNLTISNNFLFMKVMKNERICKRMIEKILDIKIDKIVYFEEEKTIDIRLGSRSIRLDVYVQDGKGTVFNVEMQTTNPHHALPQRAPILSRTHRHGIDRQRGILSSSESDVHHLHLYL